LSDAFGVRFPDRRADGERQLSAADWRTEGLRQDRRQWQQAGADILCRLRYTNLLGAGRRRQKRRELARWHHPPAGSDDPQRPILVSLSARLAWHPAIAEKARDAARI